MRWVRWKKKKQLSNLTCPVEPIIGCSVVVGRLGFIFSKEKQEVRIAIGHKVIELGELDISCYSVVA